MTLFVNACVRPESRTERIARALLAKLGGDVVELRLAEMGLHPLSAEALARRTALTAAGDSADPMFDLSRQFAAADEIVIAAPFWDFSFPALLKTYLENIYVTGIVSRYSDAGVPVGLCRAGRLWYVTTAGGPYVPDYSFDYLRALAVTAFGIGEARLVKAEMLDVVGFDAEQIVRDTIAAL